MKCPVCDIITSTGCSPAMFTQCTQCPDKTHYKYKYCKTCAQKQESCERCGDRIEDGSTYQEKLQTLIDDFNNKASFDAMYADMRDYVVKYRGEVASKSRQDLLNTKSIYDE